jgi:hypothetical protein
VGQVAPRSARRQRRQGNTDRVIGGRGVPALPAQSSNKAQTLNGLRLFYGLKAAPGRVVGEQRAGSGDESFEWGMHLLA